MNEKCLFCTAGISAVETTIDYNFNGHIDAECPFCGKYVFESTRSHQRIVYTLSELEKIAIRGIIRNFNDEKGEPYPKITPDDCKRLASSGGAPIDVTEQISNFLLILAKATKFIGARTNREHVEHWARRTFLPSGEHFKEFAGEIASRQLVHQQYTSEDNSVILKLTIYGWEEVRKIKSQKGEGTQAFVAMWFHDAMDDVFDNGFYPALDSVGYHPYRVDRAAHQNRIDDEIMAQIRKSRVLVCDVTGERGGVYFEAGFALGLGIPVIWCCNSSWSIRLQKDQHPFDDAEPIFQLSKWTDRRHFDTAHFAHIFWDDIEDLKKKLVLRIQALGLEIEENTAR